MDGVDCFPEGGEPVSLLLGESLPAVSTRLVLPDLYHVEHRSCGSCDLDTSLIDTCLNVADRHVSKRHVPDRQVSKRHVSRVLYREYVSERLVPGTHCF